MQCFYLGLRLTSAPAESHGSLREKGTGQPELAASSSNALKNDHKKEIPTPLAEGKEKRAPQILD